MKKALSGLLLRQAYEIVHLKPSTTKPNASHEEGWSDAVLHLGNLHEAFEDFVIVLKEEYQTALEKLLEADAVFLQRIDNEITVWVDVTGVFDTGHDHHQIQLSEFSRLLTLVKEWSKEAGINAWVANKRNQLPITKFQTSWFNSAFNRIRD